MTKQRPLTIRQSGKQLRLTIPKALGLEAEEKVAVMKYTDYEKLTEANVITLQEEIETKNLELSEATATIETLQKELTELKIEKTTAIDTDLIERLTIENKEANDKIANLNDTINNLQEEAKELIKYNNNNVTKVAELTKEVKSLKALATERDTLYNTSYNSLKLLAEEKVKATAKDTEAKVYHIIKEEVESVGFLGRLKGYTVTEPNVAEEIATPVIADLKESTRFIAPTTAEKIPKPKDKIHLI